MLPRVRQEREEGRGSDSVVILLLLLAAYWHHQVAPKVLNWSQLMAAAYNKVMQSIWGKEEVPSYKPCFADCIDHFLLHPGM